MMVLMMMFCPVHNAYATGEGFDGARGELETWKQRESNNLAFMPYKTFPGQKCGLLSSPALSLVDTYMPLSRRNLICAVAHSNP